MKKILFSSLAILGCANYSSGQSVPSYVPTSGLVGWWPFTGNALDSSGNANHGTVIGAKLTNDRNGNPNKAFYFDGIDDYISIAKYPSLDTLSISFWVIDSGIYPNAKTLNPRYVSSEFCDGGFAIAHNREYPSGSGKNTFLFSRNRSKPFTDMITSYQMPLDTLNFICITYNGNIFNLYINGTIYTSITNIGNVIQADSIYFGKSGCTAFGTYTDVFKGTLDDIGIWNRALSACEISKLYLASNTFFTSKPANQAVKIGASASFTIKDTLGTSATYQWQENAGTGFVNLSNTSPYSGVNTKTLDINPVAAGMHNNQYRCIRNSGTSCLDTSAAAILTLSNLSIKANQVEGLSIRPNPVHNSLNIHAPATISKMVLYNTLGQLMFESKPGTKTASIDMSVYPAGMYILKLNDEWVEKIIKE
jgi:hypothetical protein